MYIKVEDDSTELNANLLLEKSRSCEILFDKSFKTAHNWEGPNELNPVTATNKPLLQAKQTFFLMFSLQRIKKLIHSTVWLIKGLRVGVHECMHIGQHVWSLRCVAYCVCFFPMHRITGTKTNGTQLLIAKDVLMFQKAFQSRLKDIFCSLKEKQTEERSFL